jgi:hypothetical protein
VLGPDTLRPGTNSLEIFAIEGSLGTRTLRRVYRSIPVPSDTVPGISRMIIRRPVADHSTS